ncbi:fumarylacetoacetate hydrolase family protein [Lacimicrobium sp. SS2-24]|uniref:fumarylacetoacetate hydrolase family protein n=1 Tax=Lacimicrobium sp. SS2-24 TaxID=2005569 RepID=UPI000B4C0E0E|nr:fumarylacetoacetate hydrolase family protein [Lacimicrobium sp. SS2-24]
MVAYRFHDHLGQSLPYSPGKVVCVGRNYLDHIQELNNDVPEQPLLFMKPSTALQPFANEIQIPQSQGECHNELEVAVLIKAPLSHASVEDVQSAVWGYGLALDLTLRDVQTQLKTKGHPWERAKAFDGSCPLSGFVPAHGVENYKALKFSLNVNGAERQSGDTAMMIHDIDSLISEISAVFTLLPGDVVLTGTPKGVGPLVAGDRVEASLGGILNTGATVTAYD